jgi:SecY interacting protein Syd
MNQDIELALQRLTQRVLDKKQAKDSGLPIPDDLQDVDSPCLVGDAWLPKPCQPHRDFSNVEEGIELELQSSIKAFYGVQYCADMAFSWKGNPFTLLQVWSDDDFDRLQENILGHLVTQRRLKLKPTVFIGVTDAELDVISICNLTGEVILERLGTSNRDVLASDLVSFLDQVEV